MAKHGERCGSCEYFEPFTYKDGIRFKGTCHKHPPPEQARGGSVYAEQWCAEYEKDKDVTYP